MEIRMVLDKVRSNSKKLLLVAPANEIQISQAERAVGTPLPGSFKTFLTQFGNGAVINGNQDIACVGASIRDRVKRLDLFYMEMFGPPHADSEILALGSYEYIRAAKLIPFASMDGQGAWCFMAHKESPEQEYPIGYYFREINKVLPLTFTNFTAWLNSVLELGDENKTLLEFFYHQDALQEFIRQKESEDKKFREEMCSEEKAADASRLHEIGEYREILLQDTRFKDTEKKFLADKLVKSVYLNFSDSTAEGQAATKLCGQPYREAGEAWPLCPECGRKLCHLFQVNFEAAGYAPAQGVKLLVFYYCFYCNPSDCAETGWAISTYRDIKSGNAINTRAGPQYPPENEIFGLIVPCRSKVMTASFLDGADLPSIYTSEVLKRKLCQKSREHYHTYLKELRGSAWHVVSKVGGYLDCEQDPKYAQCECEKPLRHLVTIKTENGFPWIVGDIGAIYISFCSHESCGNRLYWWSDCT